MYDFRKQLAEGARFEAVLDAFFNNTWTITPATRDEQRQGIDRHFVHKTDGRSITVEYKADKTAARTGNAFVETVSVDTKNIPGWAYTSQADYLFYLIPGMDVLYILSFAQLRKQLARWTAQYSSRTIPNRGYQTIGLLVPLDEFERHAKQVISL